MRPTPEIILKSFDRLPSAEKREVCRRILRRMRELKWATLDDEAIDRIAEGALLDYDLREAADGNVDS